MLNGLRVRAGFVSQGWICNLAWPPTFSVTLGKSLPLPLGTSRSGRGLKRETLTGGGFTDPQEKTNTQIWPNLLRLKRPEPVSGSQRLLGSHGTFWKHGDDLVITVVGCCSSSQHGPGTEMSYAEHLHMIKQCPLSHTVLKCPIGHS